MKKSAFLASIVLLTAAWTSAAQTEQKSGVKVVRWIVAHDRGSSFFDELLNDFSSRVEKKSGGALKIEFIPSKASDTALDNDAYDKVLSGEDDMSQLAAGRAGVPVFDAPGVFRNYAHAEAVFNGAVGKELLGNVATSSLGKMRGFAFAYSGGYRILVGGAPVRSIDDLKGLRMRRQTSAARFMQGLGAKLVDLGPESRERPITGILTGAIDLEETEINRLALVQRDHPEMVRKLKYINLTRHRMYVTAIVANEKFLAGLSDKNRRLLTDEIATMAVAERKLSVDLEARNLKALAAGGATIVDLSKSERARFADAAKTYMKKFPEMSATIRELQAVVETQLARE